MEQKIIQFKGQSDLGMAMTLWRAIAALSNSRLNINYYYYSTRLEAFLPLPIDEDGNTN